MVGAQTTVSRRIERYAKCQDWLESSVRDLIDRAVASGWSHDEVATAVVNLAVSLYPAKSRDREIN
jgi:hypothetical protein